MTEAANPPSVVRILPDNLINKIAAGEVVERPASVVKELVENSIDSGADQISITIKNGGKDLIAVLDNGSGMTEESAKLAIERHATSKIATEADLEKIQTLGFRGEALAAISSVSKFELLTCCDEQQGAIRLFLNGGTLEEVGKVGFPKGTKITIQELFFNTPARLKFMKTTPTEFRHIQESVLNQALAHPHIQFRLMHNQQIVFNFPKGQTLEQRIYHLFGEEFQDGLIQVEHQETYLQYGGFISTPKHSKTTKRWQYLFVNDRYVKCNQVNRAIYDAYGKLLSSNQHPMFFFNLYLDPTEIDVNVHPAKTEVRFRNTQLIHTILVDHLHRTLMAGSQRRYFGEQMSSSDTADSLPPLQSKNFPGPSQVGKKQGSSNPFGQALPQDQVEMPLDLKDFLLTGQQKASQPRLSSSKPFSKTGGGTKNVKIAQQPNSQLQEKSHQNFPKPPSLESEIGEIVSLPSSPPVSESTERKWKVLGQVNRQYVAAQSAESLILVDQNAAHERVLIEQLKSGLSEQTLVSYTFEEPELVELSPQNAIVLEQYLLQLQKLGFNIAPFGRTTFSIQGIPELLVGKEYQQAILSILDALSVFGKSRHPQEVYQDAIQQIAQHASYQSGMSLSDEQAKALVAALEKLELGPYSGSGSPLYIELSYAEIEKRFKRF